MLLPTTATSSQQRLSRLPPLPAPLSCHNPGVMTHVSETSAVITGRMPSVPWVFAEALTRLPSQHRGESGAGARWGRTARGRSTNPRVHWGVMCCLLLSNLQGPPIPAKAGSLGIRALWEGEAAPRKCWGCMPGATFLHKLQTPLTRVEL